MSDTAADGKKVKRTSVAIRKIKKSSAVLSHPSTQLMVDGAIKNLKERGGSSLLAIKKYINGTYKCDSQKLDRFIKKYLKTSVANGKLIQTKGKGASGSFKLSAAANKNAKAKPTDSAVEKETTKKAISGVNEKKKILITARKTVARTVRNKKINARTNRKVAAVSKKKASEKKKTEKMNVKNIKKI
uniref:H15 domain-containing protein n=1 Tax=Glossina brevipalpis TaxID=37001 RepID=A0A1A9W0R0_9MUSC